MTNRLRNLAVLVTSLVTGSAPAFIQRSSTASAPRTSNSIVTLGEHSKVTAQPADRNRIRAFYQDVLGCKLTVRSEKLDSFQLGSSFSIGVVYDPSSPPPADISKGIWLELQTDHPEELKARILRFGIQRIDYFDKKHFYFAAPGGMVFRIVQTGEVL